MQKLMSNTNFRTKYRVYDALNKIVVFESFFSQEAEIEKAKYEAKHRTLCFVSTYRTNL